MALFRHERLDAVRRGLGKLRSSRRATAEQKELFAIAEGNELVMEALADHLEAEDKGRVRKGDGTIMKIITDFFKYIIENPDKIAAFLKIIIPLFIAV